MEDVRFFRFWKKVSISDATCWSWQGAVNGEGYGQFAFSHRRLVPAHRFAYESVKGRIPAGLQLDHLCRNRLCVRPDHLEPVTCKENIHRGLSALAVNGRPCSRGHISWVWMKNQNRFVCLDCRRADRKRRWLIEKARRS